MNSIPFLRLPFLVIQNVLSIMDPFELIHLSKVSKKTKQIVKVVLNTKRRKKYRYRPSVFIHHDYGVKISNAKNIWYYMYTSKRYGVNTDSFISTADFFFERYTYTKLEAFKNIFEWCQDLFGNFAGINLNMDDAENRMIIDYLKTKQESFKWCKVRSSSERDDEIQHFLSNLIIKSMSITARISENAEMNLPENAEHLLLYHSKCIKIEQVLALKSNLIVLDFTKFTSQDISVLLKSWVASESNLNLKRLNIVFDWTTAEDILQDIPNEEGDEFQHNYVYGESSVPGGPDIKREDGKKARVILGASMLDMYIH
ncbi:unnamed protein product [Caenorhabditis brenneri]